MNAGDVWVPKTRFRLQTVPFREGAHDFGAQLGLVERRAAAGSAYDEYVLTAKGRELQPVIIALTHWGDRWAAPAGPHVVFEHEDCGGPIELQSTCTSCGGAPTASEIRTRPGPGSLADVA